MSLISFDLLSFRSKNQDFSKLQKSHVLVSPTHARTEVSVSMVETINTHVLVLQDSQAVTVKMVSEI